MSVIPKYILTERIAQGGMAEIHLGKIVGSDGFSRVCAFKRILPHFAEDKEFIQMFRQEAMVAKQLQNKNIVQVYDFVADDQSFMLVMEYVDGQDLRSVLAATEALRRRVPVEISVYILVELLNGLAFAHSALDVTGRSMNIIHRDISPQNVLLSYEGDVKITDFGIAKVQNSNGNTQVGVLKGKFRYMSPEQAMGRIIDARSDIFAAGVILYEMVTMTRLFKGEDMVVLEQVRRCQITPPSLVRNTKIPPELEAIMMKLLAKDPQQRYQSARAAVKDLSRFLYSFRPDFFPGEVAEFMQMIFRDKLSSSRERLRSTLALPVDAIGRATRGMDVAAPESAMSTVLDVSQPPSRQRNRSAHDGAADGVVAEARASEGLAALRMGQPARGAGLLSQRVEGAPRSLRSDPAYDKPLEVDALRGPDAGGQTIRGPYGNPSGNLQDNVATNGMGIRIPIRQSQGRGHQPHFKRARETTHRSGPFAVLGLVLAIVIAVFAVALRRNNIPYVFDLELSIAPGVPFLVEINGQDIRHSSVVNSPFRKELKGGEYGVRISRPGFTTITRNVSSSLLNRSIRLPIVMLPQAPLGRLQVNTTPPRATVRSTDGFHVLERSNGEINYLPIGQPVTFEVVHPNCDRETFRVTLPASAEKSPVARNLVLRNCK